MVKRNETYLKVMSEHFSAPDLKDLVAAIGTIGSITDSEATSFAEVASYQGFDPRATLKKFYELSLKNGYKPGKEGELLQDGRPDPEKNHIITYDVEYDEGETEVEWSIPKTGHFRQDLVFLVGLYATRGTDINKIKDRSTDEMAKVIKEKAENYQIKGKDGKKSGKSRFAGKEVGGEERLGKNEITLSRLASCVPHLVCDFYSLKVGRELLVFPESKAQSWKNFPQGLRHNVLSAVWPTDWENWPKEVPYLVAIFIDRRVNPKKRQNVETIKGYQDIALKSDFFTSEMRLTTMASVVGDMVGKVPGGDLTRIFSEMKQYWKKHYDRMGDEDLEGEDEQPEEAPQFYEERIESMKASIAALEVLKTQEGKLKGSPKRK